MCKYLFLWERFLWLLTQAIIQDLKFSKGCCWGFRTSGMWHCRSVEVSGQVRVSDGSLPGKRSWYPLNKKLGGPYSQSGHFGFSNCLVCSLVSIQAALSQLISCTVVPYYFSHIHGPWLILHLTVFHFADVYDTTFGHANSTSVDCHLLFLLQSEIHMHHIRRQCGICN